MNLKKISFVLAFFILLSASATSAKSFLPTSNTRAAIKTYVKRAAKLVAKSGPSCEVFRTSAWTSGDYYIIVTGPDEKVVCHPNASIVGKASSEIVDQNGKQVGTAIVAASKKSGGGWVDYVWPRPGQTTPVKKSTYAVRVKAPDGKWYGVAAGGYELK